MSLLLIEQAQGSAVSLAEMSQQLKREDTDEDDDYIQSCLDAATDWAQQFTGLALIEQTWDMFANSFPSSGPLYLGRGLLISVDESFADGAAFSDYSVDFAASAIYLASTSSTWPSVTGSSNGIRIRFRVGYVDVTGSPTVGFEIPPLIKSAIKIYAAHLYGEREAIPTPQMQEMIRPYRIQDSLA